LSNTSHNDNIESLITSSTARIPLRYRESKEEASKLLLRVDQCRRAGYQIINPGISAIVRWLSDGRTANDFDEVTLIKKYGDEVTYDLTVPEGNAFAAGGFTVHNCNLPAEATVFIETVLVVAFSFLLTKMSKMVLLLVSRLSDLTSFFAKSIMPQLKVKNGRF
jgi:hypothetical protein